MTSITLSSDFFSSLNGDSSYLLPGKIASAAKIKSEPTSAATASASTAAAAAPGAVDSTSEAPVLGKRKRRVGPEIQQLQALEEMQETLTVLKNATVRMMQTLTKTRICNRAIREKFADRSARLQRKHIRRLAKQKEGATPGAAAAGAELDCKVPAAFFEIKPELSSLLGVPANTYVRRQDVTSWIANYIRQHQPSESDKSFQVSEELRRVIGDEWARRIESGEKAFTCFTFNLIAKERELYVRRAPEPNKQQASEIFSALGYDLELV